MNSGIINGEKKSKKDKLEFNVLPPYLEKILEKAIYSPTGDNCQSFKFEYRDHSLLIFEDIERAKHAMNNNRHTSTLAAGMLIEYIEIAATSEGYDAIFDFDKENISLRQWPLFARVEFKKQKDIKTHHLFPYLMERHTDRRPFTSSEIPESIHSTLKELEMKYPKVKMGIISDFSDNFLEINSKADAIVAKFPAMMKDLLHWVRFSTGTADKSRDGLPTQNLGITVLDAFIMLLMKRFPFLLPFFSMLMYPILVKLSKSNIEKSAGLLTFGLTDSGEGQIIDAGRSIARMWLLLTKENFAVQPHTSAVIPAFDLLTGHPIKDLPKEYFSLYLKIQSLYAKKVNWGKDTLPVFQLRFGKVEVSLSEKSRTKRRYLKDYFAEQTTFSCRNKETNAEMNNHYKKIA